MSQEEITKVIATGLVLGIVAAGIVWFLERFESARLAAQLREHLDTMSDEYKEWLAKRPGGAQ